MAKAKQKKSKHRDYAVLFLNGKRHEVRGEKVGAMLGDYLRYDLGLTGTKIVCAEGDCGACTVLRLFAGSGKRFYEPINSCITTVGQMDGSSILTVEYGAANGLDPVQKSMVACHGSQCGFCTPGFVMALKGIVDKKRVCDPKKEHLQGKEAQNALTGNLCRCTGYNQILDAAIAIPLQEIPALTESTWTKAMQAALKKEVKEPLFIETPSFSLFAPVTLKEAAAYLNQNKLARVIGAGTDVGVLVNKGKLRFHQLLSLHLIAELYAIDAKLSKKEGSRVTVGARVSLSDLRREMVSLIPQFASFLNLFASPQIKNVATLIGNVANASPIGDTLPFLLAMNAKVHLVSSKGTRTIALDKFFLKYRQTDLKKNELITSIEFDVPKAGEKLFLYKTSQRKDLDISAVNGAIRFCEDGTRVAFGGVAAVPMRMKELETFLSKDSDGDTVAKAVALLQKEIRPLSDLRGSGSFRRLLAENFLKESILEFQRGGT